MISLDGYFEGPNKELDWHTVDAEFNDYVVGFLDSLDLLLFGRVTYQLMASYWPIPEAIKNDPEVAARMNGLPKVVFSKTLDAVDWGDARLFKGDAVEEIRRLKQQPGKDIGIGGSDLAASLVPYNLIDEYRILVNPLVIGAGKPLLKGIKERLHLKLIKTKTFKSGVIILYYQPEKKEI